MQALTGVTVEAPAIMPLGADTGEYLIKVDSALAAKKLLKSLNGAEERAADAGVADDGAVPFFFQGWSADERWTEDQLTLVRSAVFQASVRARRAAEQPQVRAATANQRVLDAWGSSAGSP